jgi:hypothetical protein
VLECAGTKAFREHPMSATLFVWKMSASNVGHVSLQVGSTYMT